MLSQTHCMMLCAVILGDQKPKPGPVGLAINKLQNKSQTYLFKHMACKYTKEDMYR